MPCLVSFNFIHTYKCFFYNKHLYVFPVGSYVKLSPPTSVHFGGWIGYKLTTLGQYLIRNMYAMFGLIPFSGSLEEVICMHFP